ncbi:hypothetical protein [Flavobacterium okayamense]|uniref:DUF4163 domain-containing protein n=1 Tax=Flavobacterium okayamense TaxID=2830782 RepID=A0ABN6I0N4_9FLAO|nr:hypothetical protein [Flavobacterium okayamense]BCY28691.1 hypothetical protein KK2020170_15590 [Flavobacterium okayamense]
MKKYLILIPIILISYNVIGQKKSSKLEIICNIQLTEKEKNTDSIITKTCIFKKYKTISVGTPDFKGRYFYEYELFKLSNGNYIKIQNSELFNNSSKIEKIINEKLKIEYESNMKISEISDCMKYINFRYYKINEMGISFDEFNNMAFHVEFGIPSSCLNVGGSLIIISTSEIEKFIK